MSDSKSENIYLMYQNLYTTIHFQKEKIKLKDVKIVSRGFGYYLLMFAPVADPAVGDPATATPS